MVYPHDPQDYLICLSCMYHLNFLFPMPHVNQYSGFMPNEAVKKCGAVQS